MLYVVAVPDLMYTGSIVAINPDTGNRIRMVTQDAETGDELERLVPPRRLSLEQSPSCRVDAPALPIEP